MELDKKEAEIVQKAIQHWEGEQKITSELGNELRQSITVRNTNVDTIAVYAVISAISCGLLAFGSLVIDEKWVELLRKKWGFSESIVGFAFTVLAGLFIYLIKKRKSRTHTAKAGNEAYYIAIMLAVAMAVTYWTRSFASASSNYSIPLLIAALAYGAIAIYLHSTMMWAFMIIALAGWWGAQTHYWSNGSYRFLGMNYPLRMTIFGLIVWASSALLGRFPRTTFLKEVTYSVGLLLFLLAAWTLSIFGNYDDLSGWQTLKQSYFWYWAVGFTLVLAGLLYYAFQNTVETLRDYCLVFFLLNIYTRYFEYFWDRTNKGLFFALLAISFWFVARKAEQWRGKHA